MKIVFIIENSQVVKSEIVYEVLIIVIELFGYFVFYYGMYGLDDDVLLMYIMNGLLVGILLNLQVVDFVVMGCGMGMGFMFGCNVMLGVICGLVIDLIDVFLFGQINDGNVILMFYVKGFGWVVEFNF